MVCITKWPEDGLNNFVFLLAILLEKGKSLKPVPLHLGSLLYRLNDCVSDIIRIFWPSWCSDQCRHHFSSNGCLGEIWAVSPKLHEFATVEMIASVIRGVRLENAKNVYQSRDMSWANIKQASNKKLSEVIDTKKKFNFRPSTYNLWGISTVQYEGDRRDISLALMEDIPLRAFFWLPIVVPALLSSISESKEGMVSYNPRRVFRQLGYNRGYYDLRGDGEFKCSKYWGPIDRWRQGANSRKFKKIFWSGPARVGLWSPRVALYWRKYLEVMHTFVISKDESTLEVAPRVTTWSINSFVRIKKKTSVLAMQLKSVPHLEEGGRWRRDSYQWTKINTQDYKSFNKIFTRSKR